MNKVADFLLYAGAGKEKYRYVKDEITESNRRQLCALSVVILICVGIAFILSFFMEVLASSRLDYAVCIGLTLIIFLAAKFSRGHPNIILVYMYAFSFMLLMIGVALGTFSEPAQASVSFAVLLFAVPLLFTDAPLKADIMILVSIAIYIVAAWYTQSAEMFEFNLSCVIPYGVLTLIVSSMMMAMRVKSHVLQYENHVLSVTDQLTGMKNRRNYEEKIAEFEKMGLPQDLVVCAFDVNGLKTVNDNLGHQAGDELITAASKCIEDTFGPYGECYRTGGDEFMAILDKKAPPVLELQAEFEKNMNEFCGTYVKKLSISAGIIPAPDDRKIRELLQEADEAMYEAKTQYYVKNGIERRK